MTITSLNIADGTVGHSRLPKFRKLYKLFAVLSLLVLVVVVLVLCYHFGLFSQDDSKSGQKEILVPPNPRTALPPSASRLHTFKKAAVCADGAICAEIGKTLLEDGGSAVDAAIGTMFCNGIYTMQSMGIGGGFLMTIYIRANRTAYALNAREKAPLASTPDMFEHDAMSSQRGPMAIAVPGELKGYWTAHRRFGKLKWSEIIRPSIELCENGYNMSSHQFDSLMFHNRSHLDNDTNFREWFYDSTGKYKARGSLIVPTKLCNTLKLIAQNGGDDLYAKNGTLNKMLMEDLGHIGSIITQKDMESYTSEWMEPIKVDLNSQKLYSVPPPGSGILLGFIMNILDGFKFKPHDLEDVQSTISTYQKIIESFKYAYAERTELGDTSFVNISSLLRNLTSEEYAGEIRQKIRLNSTSQNPKDYGAVYYSPDDHGTAHISVLAENGDAVSATSSVNIYFGAGLTSPQTGIILNSVMDDFSFPYFKNFFGLPGSPNNELKPGKRPLSSMSPSILVDEKGDAKLVIGASGGTKITTAIALVIMRTIWFGQNIKEAVDAPRIHHQLYPMKVEYEYGNLQQVIDGLEALGHKTSRYKNGGSIICALLKQAGLIYANADHRKGGDVYGID